MDPTQTQTQLNDHVEAYYPINPTSGNMVCTLDPSTNPIDVVYRYGIFGDVRFVDQFPPLSSTDRHNLRAKLRNKMEEIETWFGENCGNHESYDYDYNQNCADCAERVKGLDERIRSIQQFIEVVLS